MKSLKYYFGLLMLISTILPCFSFQQKTVYDILDYGAQADGVTDNSVVINKVIDLAYSNGGGTVIIPKASKPFVFSQITVKSNIVLRGEGGVLKFKDNVATNKSKKYYPINNLGFENTTFSNLIIDGNGKNNANYLVCDVITCVGINSKVVGCKIKDAPDSGVMISNTKNGECSDNLIDGGRDCGIYVNSLKLNGNRGTKIRNNTIQNFVITGIGIKRLSNTVEVSENSIDNCGTGISLEDFTNYGFGYPKNIQIVRNTIKRTGAGNVKNTSKVGINISRGENLKVQNNNITENVGIGIYCRNGLNVDIRGNDVSTIAPIGISLKGKSQNINVIDNKTNNKRFDIDKGLNVNVIDTKR